jgi:hypothetical protein
MTGVVETPTNVASATAATGARLAMWGTLGGAVLGVGYFTVGGLFAQLSDAAGGLVGLAMVPVVVHTWERTRTVGGRVADAGLMVGLGSSVAVVASSVGLILQDSGVVAGLGRAALTTQFLGMGALGAWLLTVRGAGRKSGLFSRRVSTAAAVAGVTYLVVGIGEPATGFRQFVVYSVGGIAIVAFTLWARWAARGLDPPG